MTLGDRRKVIRVGNAAQMLVNLLNLRGGGRLFADIARHLLLILSLVSASARNLPPLPRGT